MNIWVLGGTGFIGSALVSRLSACKTRSLNLLINSRKPWRLLEGFNTFTGSIADIDPDWLKRYPPKIIYHLARPAGSNKFTRRLRASGGEKANNRLVSILGKLDDPPVVVYVSGSLMYGERSPEDPAFEDSAINPVSFAGYYRRNELPWIRAREEGIIDVRFARPGWVVGPSSWFREFYWKPFLETGKIPCYGSGTQSMSVIHIGDCASMIESLGMYGSKNSNLNIFSGVPVTQKEFSSTLADLLGTRTENISTGLVIRKYGKVTAEALLSSISMGTHYPEIRSKAAIRYMKTDELLYDVIRLLKNKEGVFAKSP